MASVTSPTNSARTVAGLIGFAVLFSLIGNEIKVSQAKPQAGQSQAGQGLTTGARIIVGGFIAAGLLVALSGAGEAGRKFAVGISVVTVTASTLVYGGPVWTALSNTVGGKPTGNTKSTGRTGNTAPTHGVATAAALAQAA